MSSIVSYRERNDLFMMDNAVKMFKIKSIKIRSFTTCIYVFCGSFWRLISKSTQLINWLTHLWLIQNYKVHILGIFIKRKLR